MSWKFVQMEWCSVVEWVKRNVLGGLVIWREKKNEEVCVCVCVFFIFYYYKKIYEWNWGS